MSAKILTPLFLSNFPNCNQLFSNFQPSAVGMTRAGNYGWVCLPTFQELNRFIDEIHGHEFKGERWIAIADYDSQISPLTPKQLREARREEQEAQREQKQLERRLKIAFETNVIDSSFDE